MDNFFILSRATYFRIVLLLIIISLVACTNSDEKNLIYAAGTGNLEEVRNLSNKVSSLDYFGYDGFTPLTIAAMNKRWDVVKYLAEKSADVTLAQRDGFNAIQWAREYNNSEIEQFLLSRIEEHSD